MPPTKKPYRGPEPDGDTFATQQEFLASLVPIPLTCLDENNRTCAYCWRSYGEPTPGCDDAEAPVRLRCNHVFGEQCMRALFGLEEPTRHDLVPLSYASGSRGADLGGRLSAYVDSHGVEKSALLSGGSREKDFARLLTTLQDFRDQGDYKRCRSYGASVLGTHWYPLFEELSLAGIKFPLGKIHLLENAVIFDMDSSADMPPYPHFDPHGNEMGVPHPGGSMANVFLSHTTMAAAVSSHLGGVSDPSGDLNSFSDSLLLGEVSPPNDIQDYGVFFSPSLEQETQKMKENETHASSGPGTWKDTLSEQSNLDKLVALQKEHGEDAASKQKALAAKQAWIGARKAKEAEMRKNQTRNFISHLARTLADVYEAYERYHYDEAVAAGRPPPIKKLKLADDTKAELPQTATPFDFGPMAPRIEVLNTMMHEKEAGAKGVEVVQPVSSVAYDDLDEEDGEPETEPASNPLSGQTILLKRRVCKKCFPAPAALAGVLSVPEYVFWYNKHKVPDNCPKCRRVLFQKNR